MLPPTTLTEGHTFTAHSLPSEARQETALVPALGYNPEILTALKSLIEEGYNGQVFSRGSLARAIGMSTAYVSIYLRLADPSPPRFTGDIAKFESRAAAFLKALREKRTLDYSVFDTPVTEEFAAFVTMCQSLNAIGLYTGNAGIGKTCAIRRFCAKNPLAIHITITPWQNTRDDVVNLLWRKFDTRGWDGNSKRWEWMARRLAAQEAVLIVDEAQMLTMSALQALRGINDLTETPIILAGNPSIIARLRSDDQLFSRVLQRRDATLPDAAVGPIVEKILRREMPEHSSELRRMARKVARERGHLRSLVQHLRFCREISQLPAYQDRPITDAFQAAHASMIHSGYQIEP